MMSVRLHIVGLMAVCFGILSGQAWNAAAADAEKQEPTRQVELNEGRIQLVAPQEWEPKKPQTRIVDFEFAVPPAEGDELPGRVTIMGAGGGVEANINRWIDQFEQPDGTSSKEKTKIEKSMLGGAEIYVVSITGTYKDRSGGGPFTRAPIIPRPNYRMLSAIIVTPNSGHYFIKLYGPEKTVSRQEKAFREMLTTLKINP